MLKERLAHHPVPRTILLLFLLFATGAMLYAAAQNSRSVRDLAGQSLESTAMALSNAAESALRESGGRADGKIREIFSDRVVAYALIAGKDGKILFHTNPDLAGSSLPENWTYDRLHSGAVFSRRILLGTGLPAYEHNHVFRRPDGDAELLRLVLHTARTDRIVSGARRMWWTAGFTLALLWTLGLLLERAIARRFRLQAEMDQRERLALIGQMTATLAHEIRNAVGGIKGYAQWVAEKVQEPPPVKAGLSGILQGTQRIESLANDLLLYSRDESFRMESVNAAPLVREALSMAVPSWAGRVDTEVPPDASVLADRERLLRVLVNGIVNAVQSMGETGRLRIAGRTEGGSVFLAIEDSGPGIPEAEIPRLFTPFHTTKADGTGLGLAYSKKVVEKMGGKISLRNRDGGGAVLAIRLPTA